MTLDSIIDDDTKNRIQALGQERDKTTIKLAKEALDIIIEFPTYPRMQVYAFVAKHAGMARDTIRKAVNALEKIPAEYWQTYHTLGFEFFKHASYLGERMEEGLKYAQERKISLDEFKVVFPTVEDKKTSEAMKEYKYPREFTGIIREAHLIGVFEDVKPHLDSIDKILKGEK